MKSSPSKGRSATQQLYPKCSSVPMAEKYCLVLLGVMLNVRCLKVVFCFCF